MSESERLREALAQVAELTKERAEGAKEFRDGVGKSFTTISERLSRIELSLKPLEAFSELERRVKALEQFKWVATGGGLVLIFLLKLLWK